MPISENFILNGDAGKYNINIMEKIPDFAFEAGRTVPVMVVLMAVGGFSV